VRFNGNCPEAVRFVLYGMAHAETSPLDIIQIRLLKQYQAEFSVIIVHLANASFSTGLFPELIKSAIVTPLLLQSWS